MAIEVVVDNRPLKMEALYGDVEMSTVWPGGSDTLTWVPSGSPARRLNGSVVTEGVFAGVNKWAGILSEPDASQDDLSASGLWRDAYNYAALDGAGAATHTVGVAIDAAAGRGMKFTRGNPLVGFSPNAADVDLSQGPVKVGELLDAWCEDQGQQWGVDPFGVVYTKVPDTVPSYQTLPLQGGLGFSLDNFASTLIGRYFNGTTFATAVVNGDDSHGTAEDVVDLTVRGTLTATKATNILTNLLALGRARPQWTNGIDLSYGEILNMGGSKVALEDVQAGKVLRIPGGYEMAQRLNGQMYLDVPIGRTTLSGGTLTIQPGDTVIGTLEDAIAAALSKKKG